MVDRYWLSFITSFFQILLIEICYVFNISSFSFSKTFSFIDNIYLKYLFLFIINILFYFILSYLLKPILKNINSYIIYFILSGVIFVINSILLQFYSLIEENGLLQSEICLFFVIIFTTTLFCSSINNFNLLE